MTSVWVRHAVHVSTPPRLPPLGGPPPGLRINVRSVGLIDQVFEFLRPHSSWTGNLLWGTKVSRDTTEYTFCAALRHYSVHLNAAVCYKYMGPTWRGPSASFGAARLAACVVAYHAMMLLRAMSIFLQAHSLSDRSLLLYSTEARNVAWKRLHGGGTRGDRSPSV